MIKLKIKNKIILGIIIPLLLSLVTTTVVGVHFLKDSTYNAIEEVSYQSAILASDMLNDMLNDLVHKAEAIGYDPIVTNPQTDPMASLTQLELLQERAEFINSSGFRISDGITADGDRVPQEVYSKIAKGESVVTSPMYNKNNELIFYIYVPVYNTYDVLTKDDYQFRVMGGFRAEYDAHLLTEVLESANIGKQGIAYIIDNNGTTIASTENFDQVKNMANTYQDYLKTGADEDLAKKELDMIKGNSGTYVYDWDNTTWISAYAPIGNYGWSVSVEVSQEEFSTTIPKAMNWIIGCGLVVLASAIVCALYIAKEISQPIKKVENELTKLSKGELPQTISANTGDEIEDMVNALNNTSNMLSNVIHDISIMLSQMSKGDFTVISQAENDYKGDFIKIKDSMSLIQETMKNTLNDIKIVGQEVNGGAEQVASASQALAQGATEQASSIQELSATITEVSTHVKETANNATEASELSNLAEQGVISSNEQMKQLIVAMDEITNTSNEISKIIKTIDDIAFQTNILALNAAVEAARAGAVGKGFAVVADEVRNLASKSAEAVKSTTTLIESAIDAVNNGVQLANETATSLKDVVIKTNEVDTKIKQIAEASEKQAVAIMQITTGIEQISAVVQTNSATSEESASASEELSGQANALDNMLSKFKTK